MKSLSAFMKSAQQFQERLQEAQDALAEKEFQGEAGGGLVRVAVDGRGDIKGVSIAPELADPNEIAVLEDLIVAACRAAKGKAAKEAAETMQRAAGGIPMPPGFPLF